MPFSLARFLSPNANVTVANAGSDTMAAEQLGQAIQNLDTNAVGLSTTDTLANKTIGTGWKTAVGSDATGDIYYRDASGNLARLPIGTLNQVLAASGSPLLPTWSANVSNPWIGFFAQAGSHSNSTSYIPIGTTLVGSSSSEAGQQNPVATAVTITKLNVLVQVAPGGTDTYTFTLRKNGADTALTATITGVATTATGTGSIAYAAGDTMDIKIVGSATAANDVGAHGSIST